MFVGLQNSPDFLEFRNYFSKGKGVKYVHGLVDQVHGGRCRGLRPA
jgi:hypothetical protein